MEHGRFWEMSTGYILTMARCNYTPYLCSTVVPFQVSQVIDSGFSFALEHDGLNKLEKRAPFERCNWWSKIGADLKRWCFGGCLLSLRFVVLEDFKLKRGDCQSYREKNFLQVNHSITLAWC